MEVTGTGLVYLTKDELLRVSFKQFITAFDDISEGSEPSCVRLTSLEGYSEWLSNAEPRLTLGWDWVLNNIDTLQKHPRRLGHPRTNICLLGTNGDPLDWQVSLSLLGNLIDTILPWVSVVRALNVYHPHLSHNVLNMTPH